MEFEKNETLEKSGKIVGFLFSYFLFTTIIFFIFRITEKLPKDWSYFHIVSVTLIIASIGFIIKKLLK